MRILLLAVFALCACASAPKPRDSDFGALRFSDSEIDRAAFAALLADSEAVRTENGWGQPIAEQATRCDAESLARSERAPWVRLANAAPDHASWAQDEAAVRERLAVVSQIEADYLEGRTPDPDYAPNAETWNVAAFAAARNASTDPRVRELFERAIRDQVRRIVAYGEAAAPFQAGLSETARAHWPFAMNLSSIDCGNTAWLRAQVTEHGWFDISRYGERADEAAWLMVQHADRTPSFQGEMLAVLQERAEAGETSPRRVAYLWDRVAVKEGRPQRYGTQMDCEGGEAQPIGGLEDPEHIEARLAVLGMQSYASYRSVMTRLAGCAN